MDQSLAGKSYTYIREKLSCGDIPPGRRLVNRTLADEIGVSVIPVREAINRLASEGLVDYVPGSGAFVRKPSQQDLDNLYVLRDALESCAAAEAARYISEDQLEDLNYYLKQSEKTAAEIREQATGHSTQVQFDRWLDDEQSFNERLVAASRNPLLEKIVGENQAISNVFEAQRNNPGLLTIEVAAQTCESKRALLDAIRSRDPELARQLMSQHIQRGRKNVLAFLRNQQRAAATNGA